MRTNRKFDFSRLSVCSARVLTLLLEICAKALQLGIGVRTRVMIRVAIHVSAHGAVAVRLVRLGECVAINGASAVRLSLIHI